MWSVSKELLFKPACLQVQFFLLMITRESECFSMLSLSSELFLPTSLYSEPFFKGRVPLGGRVNRSYRPGSDGRSIVASKALNQFKKDAYLTLSDRLTTFRNEEVIAKIAESVKTPPYIHTPLVMWIRIYSKTLWYYDIDGMEKAVIDAVFGRMAMKEYDNLIVDKYTTKRIDKKDPHIEVILSCVLSPVLK